METGVAVEAYCVLGDVVQKQKRNGEVQAKDVDGQDFTWRAGLAWLTCIQVVTQVGPALFPLYLLWSLCSELHHISASTNGRASLPRLTANAGMQG